MKKVSPNTYELTDEEVKMLQGKSSGLWIPESYQEYFYIDGYGDVCASTWNDTQSDKFLLSQGNCFRTEEEANKHLAYLNALGRVRMYILENHPFEPGELERGREIYYRHDFAAFDASLVSDTQYAPLLPLMPSYEATNDVIANCESDLRIIWGLE